MYRCRRYFVCSCNSHLFSTSFALASMNNQAQHISKSMYCLSKLEDQEAGAF